MPGQAFIVSIVVAEKALPVAEFLITGNYTGAAIHAGYIPFVPPRKHTHETCLLAPLAIGAFCNPCAVHRNTQRCRVYPAKEHLH